MHLPILITLIGLIGLTSCHAEPVAEPDIKKCSHGAFRINAYLETAAALEAMPKEQALALLQKWTRQNGDDAASVIILCRMLFTENPDLKCKFDANGVYTGEVEKSHPLRRPRIGGTFFIGGPRSVGGSGSEDPDGSKERAMYGKLLDPIALIDGIPLLVSNGYFSSGPRPETAAEYLDYCIASGVWGKITFRKATKEEMEAAVRKYQKDYALRPLDKMEINELNDQMKEPDTISHDLKVRKP